MLTAVDPTKLRPQLRSMTEEELTQLLRREESTRAAE